MVLEVEDILEFKFNALEVVLNHRGLLYLECNKKKSAITIHLFHLLFCVGSSGSEWMEALIEAERLERELSLVHDCHLMEKARNTHRS